MCRLPCTPLRHRRPLPRGSDRDTPQRGHIGLPYMGCRHCRQSIRQGCKFRFRRGHPPYKYFHHRTLPIQHCECSPLMGHRSRWCRHRCHRIRSGNPQHNRLPQHCRESPRCTHCHRHKGAHPGQRQFHRSHSSKRPWCRGAGCPGRNFHFPGIHLRERLFPE